MGNGRTGLDREGCEYGRALAKDVGGLREDMGEVKADVKTLIVAVARIEQSMQSSKAGGGKRGSSKEFWASMVALAMALASVAMVLAKAG